MAAQGIVKDIRLINEFKRLKDSEGREVWLKRKNSRSVDSPGSKKVFQQKYHEFEGVKH